MGILKLIADLFRSEEEEVKYFEVEDLHGQIVRVGYVLDHDPKTEADLLKVFTAFKLQEYFPAFRPLIRESLVFKMEDDEAGNSQGKTKCGGKPDLPESFKWPVNAENIPLAFLAQVNLAECESVDDLPSTGMLYFFFNLDSDNWSESSPQSDFKVIHAETFSTMEKNFPEGLMEEFKFEAVLMKSHKALQIPDSRSEAFPPGFPPRVEDQLDQLAAGIPFTNMLLGHSQPVQEDMYQQCVFADHGVEYPEINSDSFLEIVLKEKDNWIPLFQFGGEEMSRFNLGDEGSVYYWIKKEDLRALKFDNVKGFFQSH